MHNEVCGCLFCSPKRDRRLKKKKRRRLKTVPKEFPQLARKDTISAWKQHSTFDHFSHDAPYWPHVNWKQKWNEGKQEHSNRTTNKWERLIWLCHGTDMVVCQAFRENVPHLAISGLSSEALNLLRKQVEKTTAMLPPGIPPLHICHFLPSYSSPAIPTSQGGFCNYKKVATREENWGGGW